MHITVRMTVTIHRADGTHTEITEERHRDAGDNPRFEGAEVATAAAITLGAIATHYPENRPTLDTDRRCHSWHKGRRCEGDQSHTGNHHNINAGSNW